MAYYVGDLLSEQFTVVDNLDAPISGLTFAITATGPSGAITVSQPAEVAPGRYEVSYQTTDGIDIPGDYEITLIANDPWQRQFIATFELLPGSRAGATAGITRKDLRRAILSYVGDIVVVTATAATGSSQFTDEDNLVGEAGRYAGRELYMTDGTLANVGETRQIIGSNRAYTLQLSRGLPASVAVGDEAEVVNTYGSAFRIQRVHEAINTAIRNGATETRIIMDVATAYSRTSRSIAIPDEFTAIDGVQYVRANDSTSGWTNMDRAKTLGANGWFVDRANRSIYVGQSFGYDADGFTVRLSGWTEPAPLVDDSDRTLVNSEWLISQVSADLLLRSVGSARSISPEWERKGFYFDQEANKNRDLTRSRRSPNYVRL